MLNKKFILLFFGLTLLLYSESYCLVSDSLRVVTEGNNKIVIHRVDQGETLYSISRRYDISVQDLVRENPGTDKNLKIGQELRILISPAVSDQRTGINPGQGYHIVEPSETLYSISRKYGVTVEQIREWNQLTENTLKVGMRLRIKPGTSTSISSTAEKAEVAAGAGREHVVKQSETLYSIARMYNTTPGELRKLNNLTDNNLSIGQRLLVGTSAPTVAVKRDQTESNSSMLPPSTSPKKEKEEKILIPQEKQVPPPPVAPSGAGQADEVESDYTDVTKVVEHGLAEVIEDGSETRKYLALHRTAPIGTIMQIRNEMNDQIVFVRVVGTIQNTGDNDKILVKISKKAFDRLGAVDNRFPVELSYIP